MDQKYLYKKEYQMTLSGSIHLSNPELALEYCNEKFNALINAKNHAEELSIKLEILRDFEEIYEFDCNYAIRPEPFGTFRDRSEKEAFIRLKQLVEDFYLYLGNVFCSYHAYLVDQKRIPLIDFQPFIIDYNELYQTAVNEYFGALLGVVYPLRVFPLEGQNKAAIEYLRSMTTEYVDYRGVKMPAQVLIKGQMPERSPHAPAATFILPAIIDHSLLMYLQNSVLFMGLKGLDDKLNELSPAEREVYDAFHKGTTILNGTQKQTMKDVYKMMVSHRIITRDEDIKKVITGKEMTLGAVLHSQYSKAHIRPEYFSLLQNLFDTKRLNIRNCIMHGNSMTYDYLAIGITSVILQLLWNLSQGDVLI